MGASYIHLRFRSMFGRRHDLALAVFAAIHWRLSEQVLFLKHGPIPDASLSAATHSID